LPTPTIANGLQVDRAVGQPPISAGAHDAAQLQHPEVPGDPRLAHPEGQRELVDGLLAGTQEVLDDAQPGHVGQRGEEGGQVTLLSGETHKQFFMRC
jgi:hypothetical protein